ncbi:MAG: ECF transporter S component [Oscillospiraceae bacterium]|nr:ECF transporter S component [Oscillospiraceae bacterium]
MWETLQQNLSFVLISAAIAVVIALAAKFAERYFKDLHKVRPARRICIIAICGAIAAVLHMLDFPLLFLAPGFYKLDFSELPVMLCGFYLGPSAAVFCEVIKIILKLLFKSTSTAFVGDFANFVVGCSLVLPAVIVYHTHKSKTSALWGCIIGTLVLTVVGSFFNAVYLLPKFSQLYSLPLDSIIAMGAEINTGITNISSFVMLAVAPLNLIKGTMISVLTILLYKKVARPLFGRNS